MELKIEIEKVMSLEPKYEIGKYRQWFRDAADFWRDWQTEAREDYEFVEGKQWNESDRKKLAETGRVPLVINRIKPLINLLSGYQKLHRYDVNFLGRTPDDVELAEVRKDVTKYICDRCGYDNEESAAFEDMAIGGLGWLFVGYKVNEETGKGEAYIQRENPFSIYADPEAHKADFSDAKYIFRAKWTDKEELKSIYPEHATEIDAQFAIYDTAEEENSVRDNELLWYKRELQKVRLVECWYKTRVSQEKIILSNGEEIMTEELTPEMFLQGQVTGIKKYDATEVRCCVFFDRVILEEMKSPYKHGEFPLVPMTLFYYGIGGDEIPAGIVRDLKAPQREINKRRLQQLHILNTTGNGGGWIEDDAMTEKQFAEFERKGNIPGHFQRVRPGTIAQGKIQERQIGQYPVGLAQAEAQATADLTAISGLNEALMGVEVPSHASGRAIQLKQQQAITHLANCFDAQRTAKKKIAYLLWGEEGKAGIIPQFYTAEEIYRVEGVNGQKFITVNQQVIEQDPIAGTVVKTLNDLSIGNFDIVVADIESSVTQKQAKAWLILDAVAQLNLPPNIAYDLVLDNLDIPKKNELKERLKQQEESQAKAAQEELQMKLQLEEIKNQNAHQSISFKDAPPEIQYAMAAKQGLIPQEVADYVMQLAIQNQFPELAMQQQQAQLQQAQMQQQMQNLPPELQAQMQGEMLPPEVQAQMQQELPPEMQNQEMPQGQIDQLLAMQNQPPQNNSRALTQPAVENLLAGITPAL